MAHPAPVSISNPPAGLLVIELLNATVPPMDMNGKCDAYVVLKCGARQYRSPVQKKTLTPKWNHEFRLLLRPEELGYDLNFELWDQDKLSADDYIATITLSFSNIISTNQATDVKLDYVCKAKSKYKDLHLNIRMEYLSQEKMERTFWQSVVTYFDQDGNNQIDIDELKILLEGIHSDSSVIDAIGSERLFEMMDTNKDGALSPDELYEFMSNRDDPLIQKIQGPTNELIWNAFMRIHKGESITDVILNQKNISVEALISKSAENQDTKNQILVQNRETGKLEIELIPNYIRISMKLMYSTAVGKKAVGHVNGVLKKMTVRQGKVYSAPSSKEAIPPFIDFHHLNIDEMLNEDLDSYANFNEFFYRKLKPSARPISNPENENIVVSPADCRLNVFPTVSKAQEFWIKGDTFNLLSLLQDDVLANQYANGSILIARLAPQDYHRFHSPVSGRLGKFNVIEGSYYTVNPIAINQKIDVYGSNKRLITIIESPSCGPVVFIAVGATMVGSICMTANEGSQVRKGDELGYFAFGGSTCLLLFLPGAVTFDRDLLVNSAKPIETLVKVGDHVATANK